MSLKLIREALLRNTLGADKSAMLDVVKKATGMNSILDLVESFVPSAEDYDAWMRVAVEEAQERGINLNKRGDFVSLVMDILENDPASPPLEMQELIANKLWQDYKAAKQEVRIGNVAKAKEEEEKVENARKQITARYAQGPTSIVTTNPSAYDEEEMGISDELAATKIFNKIKGTPNLSFVNVEQMVAKYLPMVGKAQTDAKYIATLVYDKLSDVGMEDEESGFEQAFNVAKGTEEEEGDMSFLKDVLKDRPRRSIDKGSFSSHLRDDEDADDADVELVDTLDVNDDGELSDDEIFTSTDDDDECSCADDIDTDIDVDDVGSPDEDLDDDTLTTDENMSRVTSPKKFYDEEEAVKSFFRQAVTSPRSMLSQAVKDIEEEGKAAWRKANVPSNPHPQKSQAYRAWQKGLHTAAKETLGIVDKPKQVIKPKRKK